MQSPAPRKLIHEAAEFLVLSELLRRGIEAYKAYSGFPGYDVLAIGSRRCRIQVKSRAAVDFDHLFDVGGDIAIECDYVVLVALDRERLGMDAVDTLAPARCWVVPASIAAKRRRPGKRPRLKYDDVSEFADDWSGVTAFLGGDGS